MTTPYVLQYQLLKRNPSKKWSDYRWLEEPKTLARLERELKFVRKSFSDKCNYRIIKRIETVIA